MEVRPVLDPSGTLNSPLDQKIGAAIRRNAPSVEPAAAAKMASLPKMNLLTNS
jgi:hypothetical protein